MPREGSKNRVSAQPKVSPADAQGAVFQCAAMGSDDTIVGLSIPWQIRGEVVSDEQTQQHDECMQRFVDLANNMKDEGIPVNLVSWSLMTASGIYATYSVTGNSGGLNPSGVDKITDAYKQNLTNIQSLRQAQDTKS